jgi:hypothetical protein|tara:strand:- start:6007 stop:6366 length:360 start_codon:yes stop_codon:yes gene_type:complete
MTKNINNITIRYGTLLNELSFKFFDINEEINYNSDIHLRHSIKNLEKNLGDKYKIIIVQNYANKWINRIVKLQKQNRIDKSDDRINNLIKKMKQLKNNTDIGVANSILNKQPTNFIKIS